MGKAIRVTNRKSRRVATIEPRWEVLDMQRLLKNRIKSFWHQYRHKLREIFVNRADRNCPKKQFRRRMIDPGTFGSSPAAFSLANILSELDDQKITRRTCKYLADQFTLINSVQDIHSVEHRQVIYCLLKKSWQAQLTELPLVVKTHTLNLLHCKVRRVSYQHNRRWPREYLLDE